MEERVQVSVACLHGASKDRAWGWSMEAFRKGFWLWVPRGLREVLRLEKRRLSGVVTGLWMVAGCRSGSRRQARRCCARFCLRRRGGRPSGAATSLHGGVSNEPAPTQHSVWRPTGSGWWRAAGFPGRTGSISARRILPNPRLPPRACAQIRHATQEGVGGHRGDLEEAVRGEACAPPTRQSEADATGVSRSSVH